MEQFKRIYFPSGLTKTSTEVDSLEEEADSQATMTMEDLIKQTNDN